MLAFYIMRCMERRKRREQVEMSPSTTQSTKFPKYIFLLPALCDTLATSTMYLGLTLTYASSFQMLRGERERERERERLICYFYIFFI
ncbi:Solute carrier family 35 member F6 [Portunus trituberculatus]|uniref:Solute carrier family 35 member F6 n=1 Tax=Portunus trituberculatus TaxID=210409 RepID=A0A5B7JZE2_PORTR|nr:Solute carrier family 35 member F6 [Portunus trituberculatus]